MKHLYLSAALLATTGLCAQTTALDFTANDCDGVPHNLFSELDAGNAVILELVMMGCQPCIDAAHSITDNVLPNVSDPARLKFYSIGYTNSISCTQINNWKNNNGFTHIVFAGMSAQTTYYGGMGMPTVVVLGGGATHGVYYVEQGHDDSDNTAITAAVNEALLDANSIAESGARPLAFGPNPVTNTLNLNSTYMAVKVTDMKGRVVMDAGMVGSTLDVSTLPAGAYSIELIAADRSRSVGRFVKQ
mgnify:CR=1 FL=1